LRRLLFIISLSLATFWSMNAQIEKEKNQPYADQKFFHLGFHVGLHTQDLILTNNGIATAEGETWYAEVPDYSPGFSVGAIGDMYLSPYFSLRFTPTIHFGDKKIIFHELKTDETYTTQLRSNYLTFPLDLKYSAFRINNYRPYMLAGVYTAFDLGRKKGNVMYLKSQNFGVEVGLGCDLYLPFFKLCPEIKFCFGLGDVLEHNRKDLTDTTLKKYSEALSKATSRLVVFTFNFE